MSAPRPRGYAWVFAHSRFGGQRTGRKESLALASPGKDGRGGCADLPACGEALAPLRPHRLERPVAGPGGDGYAIWSLTGLAVYDRYHLWQGGAGCYVLTRVRPLWAHAFALSRVWFAWQRSVSGGSLGQSALVTKAGANNFSSLSAETIQLVTSPAAWMDGERQKWAGSTGCVGGWGWCGGIDFLDSGSRPE